MTQERKQTPPNPDDFPWLVIYGQRAWHQEAYIEGNRVALSGLRDAIDKALSQSIETRAEGCVPADGEGYEVVIRIRRFEGFEKERLPYTAPYANPELMKEATAELRASKRARPARSALKLAKGEE